MSQLTREQKILIAAARSVLSDFNPGELEPLLGEELNWRYILVIGGKHGVAPLLQAVLSGNGLTELVPPEVTESLRKNYLTSLMNNKKLYQSLAAIYDSFAAEGIEMILLKGGALGMNLYDDFALRPFSDLDILVKKHDVGKCRTLMEDLGFSLARGVYGAIPDERNDELGCEWTYYRDSAVIELHWNLMTRLSPFQLDADHFWDSAEPLEFENRRALAMGAEDQLIHLCLHQFKHHWEHLRDLADVALLIDKRRTEIDWAMLAERAAHQKAERCVYHTLSLAKRVIDSPVPDSALSILGEYYKPGVMTRALEDLIAANIFETNMPRRFWELILVDGMDNKAKVVRDVISRPFPRRGDEEPFGKQKAHDIGGKLKAAFKSIVYYSWIFTAYPRHLLRAIMDRYH